MRIRILAWFFIAGIPGFPALAQDGPLRVELVAAQEQPVEIDLQLSGTITATDSVQMSFQAGRPVIRSGCLCRNCRCAATAGWRASG